MSVKGILLTVSLFLCVISTFVNIVNSLVPGEIKVQDDENADQSTDKVQNRDTVSGKINRNAFNTYVRLFNQNRAMQIEAVKKLVNADWKYEKKYLTAETTLNNLFLVLEQAKNNLTEWGFVPGDPFPDNMTIQDAFSKVLENTAIYGDLVLRMPDIIHAIYNKNKQWEFLIGWGVWFAMESKVFKGSNEKLLNLMSQELGLIPKEEYYTNPYAEVETLKDDLEVHKVMEEKLKSIKLEKIKKKSQETKEKKKGPRLSGAHTEL